MKKHLLLIVLVIFITGCGISTAAAGNTSIQNSTDGPVAYEENNPEEMTITIGGQVFSVIPGEHAEITINEPEGAEPVLINSSSAPWSSVASIYYNGEIYWEDVLGAVQFFIPDKAGKYDYRISVIQDEGAEEKIYTFTVNYKI